MSERVFWHRELPPLDGEVVAEQLIDAHSDRVPGGLSIAMRFLGARAVGDFGADLDGVWGALLHMDVGLGRSVFRLGGEFGGMGYGSETRSDYIGNQIP